MPCECWFLYLSVSKRSTLRRHRPSTTAPFMPAGPPPITIQSYNSSAFIFKLRPIEANIMLGSGYFPGFCCLFKHDGTGVQKLKAIVDGEADQFSFFLTWRFRIQ